METNTFTDSPGQRALNSVCQLISLIGVLWLWARVKNNMHAARLLVVGHLFAVESYLFLLQLQFSSWNNRWLPSSLTSHAAALRPSERKR